MVLVGLSHEKAQGVEVFLDAFVFLWPEVESFLKFAGFEGAVNHPKW